MRTRSELPRESFADDLRIDRGCPGNPSEDVASVRWRGVEEDRPERCERGRLCNSGGCEPATCAADSQTIPGQCARHSAGGCAGVLVRCDLQVCPRVLPGCLGGLLFNLSIWFDWRVFQHYRAVLACFLTMCPQYIRFLIGCDAVTALECCACSDVTSGCHHPQPISVRFAVMPLTRSESVV